MFVVNTIMNFLFLAPLAPVLSSAAIIHHYQGNPQGSFGHPSYSGHMLRPFDLPSFTQPGKGNWVATFHSNGSIASLVDALSVFPANLLSDLSANDGDSTTHITYCTNKSLNKHGKKITLESLANYCGAHNTVDSGKSIDYSNEGVRAYTCNWAPDRVECSNPRVHRADFLIGSYCTGSDSPSGYVWFVDENAYQVYGFDNDKFYFCDQGEGK
ncbi:hypothetical protein B0H63DRAFT_565420 [Podospora didyma]|uniref:Secreted protein n=1 Tax=Podospora didyma TaxID=330526 RepID=A0AAE0K2B2_9PEZI|nr:hypothetical protein B0H63DRAFT_565420 [Podospora didyma]